MPNTGYIRVDGAIIAPEQLAALRGEAQPTVLGMMAPPAEGGECETPPTVLVEGGVLGFRFRRRHEIVY